MKQIFDFYRKINTVIKKQKVISSGSGGDLFSDIVGMNNIITLADFIKFLSDFKICPHILHKDLVREIFSIATRHGASKDGKDGTSGSGGKNDGAGGGSSNSSRPSSAHRSKSTAGGGSGGTRPITAPLGRIEKGKWGLMGATFEAFLDCVGRCAIAADFSEPCKYVGDVQKLIGFMILLELDEGGDWRKKMRSYGSPPRTSKMIRDSMTSSQRSGRGVPLVRIGASGSPARGAGLRAVRRATSPPTSGRK